MTTHTHMKYRYSRQNDGTYNIEHSLFGLNWEIILIGIRGCNVERMINKLYLKDYTHMKPKLKNYMVIQTTYICMNIQAANEEEAENIMMNERAGPTNRYLSAECEADCYYNIEEIEKSHK